MGILSLVILVVPLVWWYFIFFSSAFSFFKLHVSVLFCFYMWLSLVYKKNKVSYRVVLLSSEYILTPLPFLNLVPYLLPFVLFFTKYSIYAVSSFLNCISYCLLSFLVLFTSFNLYVIFKCIVPYYEKMVVIPCFWLFVSNITHSFYYVMLGIFYLLCFV